MRILSKEFQQIGEDEFLEMRTKTLTASQQIGEVEMRTSL